MRCDLCEFDYGVKAVDFGGDTLHLCVACAPEIGTDPIRAIQDLTGVIHDLRSGLIRAHHEIHTSNLALAVNDVASSEIGKTLLMQLYMLHAVYYAAVNVSYQQSGHVITEEQHAMLSKTIGNYGWWTSVHAEYEVPYNIPASYEDVQRIVDAEIERIKEQFATDAVL
jgi:hypothetical protein